MLTEICNYLKNWFSNEHYIGAIAITNGIIRCNSKLVEIAEGQYFRVIGSILSDGVYKYGTDTLDDEEFTGAVWLMRVPADVIAIAAEVTEWMEKYGGADSSANSPYNSESFGGYSYSKSSGGSSDGSADLAPAWAKAYGARLSRYKKI